MKNYRDSDYAVNKYASGIVYRFANQTVTVTLADYLRENPSKTEADFARLKALSDELYLEQDRQDNAQSRKIVSIHSLEERELCAASSPEETVIDEPDQAAEQKRRCGLAHRALQSLTPTQRRRYIQHIRDGLSTWEIAAMEGTNQKSVYESIQAAKKKIKKVLANG